MFVLYAIIFIVKVNLCLIRLICRCIHSAKLQSLLSPRMESGSFENSTPVMPIHMDKNRKRLSAAKLSSLCPNLAQSWDKQRKVEIPMRHPNAVI